MKTRRIFIAGWLLVFIGSLLALSTANARQPVTSPTPTFRQTLRVISATPRQATPTPTISPTPTLSPTPTVTTVFTELREQVTDTDLAVRFLLDSTCFLADSEITGRVVLRNLKDDPIFVYLSGQIAFSINNSPLLPDFEPRGPTRAEEFLFLQPNDEVALFELEDLGLFVQGMGPESGIDFSASETIFGLPIGDYWITAAYTNPHDGLDEQIDGTYLIPQAAWTGLSISRELRFSVVDNLDNC